MIDSWPGRHVDDRARHEERRDLALAVFVEAMVCSSMPRCRRCRHRRRADAFGVGSVMQARVVERLTEAASRNG
jgi:hypothetical protein